jgi:hypothetical protein
MRLKQMVVMLAVAALALPLAAQMGMGPQVPNLSGIWRPVVGSGSTYEITRDGNKTNMDFAVLGKEDFAGKTGYWVEMSMTYPKGGGDMLIKILETVDGNSITYSRWVMQMPGQQPMEMDPNMMNMGGRKTYESQDTDFRNKAELVGTESISVPAGTFSCEHYRMKDGSGDAWISDKVSPWSLVKMQDKLRTMVLVKVTTDAKDRITGTPTKFDPMQMMRNRMGQQGQQPQ